MGKFAALCVLAAVGEMAAAPALAATQTTQMQVSLTIQCVAQDEVAQCGNQTFLAKKETTDFSAADSSESGAAPEGASPALKRRLVTITY